MEKFSTITNQVQTELELPPGFRFHPTDEELITHYLSPKVLDNGFSAIIIGEIDLNKVEPWELPRKAKMGEKEWYFFFKRDRKYPTGLRTNRASGTGYWKATGRDKDIFKGKILVGKKKSLVFYKGRAPKGEKSNWVMHEYRLVGRNCVSNSTQSSKATKDEWVICRIYNKSSGGKKIDISELLLKTNKHDDTVESKNLPALMDFSSDNKIPKKTISTDFLPRHNNLIIPGVPIYSSSRISDFSQLPLHFPKVSPVQDLPFSTQFMPSDLSFLQQQSILGLLLEKSNGPGSKENANVGFSVDSDMCFPPLDNQGSELWAYEYGDQEFPGIDTGPVGLDCLWN